MAQSLTVRLLGPALVEHHGTPVRGFASRKVLALLAYLILEQRPVSRSQLGSLFWSDKPTAQARANLSWSLHALVHAVPDSFKVGRDSVAWSGNTSHFVDVAAFRTLSAQGDVQSLEQAVALYRGSLLGGLDLDDAPGWEAWLTEERGRWQQLVIDNLHALATQYFNVGDYTAGLEATGRWLQVDRLDEAAHRLRMRAFEASGQRGAAIAQYETCQRLLLHELDVEPSPQTLAIYDRIRLASGAGIRPTPLAPLIGRERELQRLEQLVTVAARRLVCIVGPGGVGKSALALQGAARLAPQFESGAVVVDTTGVGDMEALAKAIAAQIGWQIPTDRPWIQLLNFLGGKQLLLVLDHWDHLVGVSGMLTDLVLAAPGIKLLVTSRERLPAPRAEHIELGGLSTTAQEADVPSAAVRLFVDRARRGCRTWRLSSENREYVERICRHVDGLPLAIELASSWVRTLDVSDIAAEVIASTDLLTSCFQDLPERHRRIETVWDASWERLLPAERRVLAALAAFAASFDADAAQTVAETTAVTLRALTAKSLLREAGPGRFDLHPLVRRYAVTKLLADPVAAKAVYERHCDVYTELLEGGNLAMLGTSDRTRAAEIENVQAAWSWAVRQCDIDHLSRMVPGLATWYENSGQYRLGDQCLGQAVTALEQALGASATIVGSAAATVLGKLLSRQGKLCYLLNLDAHTKVRRLLLRSLSLLADTDRSESALVLNTLGNVARMLGDYPRAKDAYRESMAAWDATGDLSGIARSHVSLGMVADDLGSYTDAEQHFGEALRLYQQLDDQSGLSTGFNFLGYVAVSRGHYERAEELWQQSLELSTAAGDQWGVARATMNLGAVAGETGAYDLARRLLHDALQKCVKLGDRWALARVHTIIGAVCAQMALFSEGRQHCETSLHMCVSIDDHWGVARTCITLGRIARGLEDYPSAQRYLQQAIQHAQRIHVRRLLLPALVEWAALPPALVKPLQALELVTLICEDPVAEARDRSAAVARRADLVPGLTPDLVAAAGIQARLLGITRLADLILAERGAESAAEVPFAADSLSAPANRLPWPATLPPGAP